MMDGFDGAGMGFGWLFMTVFWVALIAAIVWVIATLLPRRRPDERPVAERPDEILDRRLAHGEIDTATYDALRAKMRGAQAGRV